MSLQDEINRLQQSGDPKETIIEFLRNDIEKAFEYNTQTIYQEICKRIASKEVLGAQVSNTVSIDSFLRLSFNHAHPAYRTYISVYKDLGALNISHLFPDIEITEYDGDVNCLLELAKNKNQYSLILTESGKRFFNMLARKCASDRITIKPMTQTFADYYNGKKEVQTYEIGKSFHCPLFRQTQRISKASLVAQFSYNG